MTKEEAIETIQMAIAEVEWEYPMDYAAAFDMAISALQSQIEEEKNEPLTVRELREMDGEPVWVTDNEGRAMWCLVHVYQDGHTVEAVAATLCSRYVWPGWCYGTMCPGSWLAYRRKPEVLK